MTRAREARGHHITLEAVMSMILSLQRFEEGAGMDPCIFSGLSCSSCNSCGSNISQSCATTFKLSPT